MEIEIIKNIRYFFVIKVINPMNYAIMQNRCQYFDITIGFFPIQNQTARCFCDFFDTVIFN